MNTRDRIIFLLVIVTNAIYNAFMPLHEDEAYYWVWGKKLELGYFDHPPMVAYVSKLFSLPGDNEFLVRLAAVFCMSVSAWLLLRLVKDAFSEQVMSVTLYVTLASIIVQGGFMLMTPDSPLMLFWALSLYFAYQYLFNGHKWAAWLTGIFIGFTMLSKYTGILLPIAFLLFMLSTDKRKLILQKEIWIAGLLALVAFSPALIWNYQHDWLSFSFQFNHGIAQEKTFHPEYLLEFIGGQVGIFNPVFFIALLIFIVGQHKLIRQHPELLFMLFCFLIPFAFFTWHSAFQRSEVNWPAPASISAFALVGYFVVAFNLKKTLYAGVTLTLIIMALIKFPMLTPDTLTPVKLLQARLVGFNTVKDQLDPAIRLEDYDYLLIKDLHDADVVYELRAAEKSMIVTDSRFSQYDLWREAEFKLPEEKWREMLADPMIKFPMKNALYIGSADRGTQLRSLFTEVNLLQVLRYEDPWVAKTYYVYSVNN
ncbi:MAG: hypothetical protein COA99_16750 [Moraxellaceae bacterium]|nr:MAG: hypothetical protein COA99_16750 [Moraxellaceae bacterium]